MILQKAYLHIPFLFLTGCAGNTVNRYQVPEEMILNTPIASKELEEKWMEILNRRPS